MFKIYKSGVIGDQTNCAYKNEVEVHDAESLKNAINKDYVCAKYKDGYRSKDNFIESDCLSVDCDNDTTDDSSKWLTPEAIKERFPDVTFAVHYSRHHMIDKKYYDKNKNVTKVVTARPRFHVFFEIDKITSQEAYSNLKNYLNSMCPYFDSNALDAARFFFGTEDPKVDYFEGKITLTEFLDDEDEFDKDFDKIKEGNRNATMSKYAGRVLIRFGNTEEAHKAFLTKAGKCEPPLDDAELATIWNSALKFYKKVASSPDYVAPDSYHGSSSYWPDDYSDIGQAKVLIENRGQELIYTDATDYLNYNGQYWEESKQKAVAVMEDFLDKQLEDSNSKIDEAVKELKDSGVAEADLFSASKKVEASLVGKQLEAYKKFNSAKIYKAFVMKRRDMKYVVSALQAAKPMVLHNVNELDADGYLINVPGFTLDLRKGIKDAYQPKAEDLITRQTSVAPSDQGKQIWLDALDLVFCHDQPLIDYVQEIVGLAAIGKVLIEALIIAFGEGRNGKSTFWNTISKVLGTYSGSISADTLTVGCKRNVKPEMAELKGKRLVIAAELEEGTRLNTSVVKQLSSTDEISAEKKYKDPFKFTPSHMVVLYTNHLPRVGAIDQGTWRRIIVIPFNAKIEGKNDIKNYADYLYKQAGPAVMSWIIDGARKAALKGGKIEEPEIVREAIAKYRKLNDWIHIFLDECCDADKTYTERSGELYREYRTYCANNGEYTRSTTDFYSALEQLGFERHNTNKCVIIRGLRLKEGIDFL